MSTPPFTPAQVHNAACEHAEQAICHCFCHGAGHQNDLIVRAASCASATDLATLQADLDRIFGAFHADDKDVTSSTRGSRGVPTPAEIAVLSVHTGRGATWRETLLVDEALHAAFLDVATASLAGSSGLRDAQCSFVGGVTQRAIGIVGTKTMTHTIVESHVWCSIVAEFLSSHVHSSASTPPPATFGAIRYPRKSVGRLPASLAAMRGPGISHLAAEFGARSALSPPDKLKLLQLVGAATCPDLWQHSAAVRYSMQPFVDSASWPPPSTTTVAINSAFSRLRSQWSFKGAW